MARYKSKKNMKAGRKFTRRFIRRMMKDSDGECIVLIIVGC